MCRFLKTGIIKAEILPTTVTPEPKNLTFASISKNPNIILLLQGFSVTVFSKTPLSPTHESSTPHCHQQFFNSSLVSPRLLLHKPDELLH